MARLPRREKANRRVRLDVDERRAQLIGLGLEAFGRRPYDDVSVDDIARDAGISKGLLYHYFPTKRDFYTEVVREAAKQLLERTIPDADLPAPGRLAAGLDAYLSFVEEHGAAYAALMRGGSADTELRGIINQTRSALIERLLGGVPVEVTPALRMTLVGWVGFVEATSLDWIGRNDLSREQMGHLLASALLVLLQGLGVAPP